MKFRICSAYWYGIEELIQHYPCLTEFGFKIERGEKPKYCTIKDENGNNIQFVYDVIVNHTPYIYIHSLDELAKLVEMVDASVVVDTKNMEITIYDGYLE